MPNNVVQRHGKAEAIVQIGFVTDVHVSKLPLGNCCAIALTERAIPAKIVKLFSF
jgi:hypothetical protein